MSSLHRFLIAGMCLAVIGCNSEFPGGAGSAVLSGQIRSAGAAKLKASGLNLAADEGYMVVAQNNNNGNIYRAVTDAAGAFELSIPASEAGSSFVVSIVGPDGRAVGPVMYAQGEGQGVTGLRIEGETSLGTVNLPEDPEHDAILPGADADLGDKVAPDIVTRLNADGAPLGLASNGKGADARGDAGNGADADRDGLVDMLDADDDGDGLVDDFDPDTAVGGGPSDIRVNFFMNLKIQAEEAETYYAGSEADRNAALGLNTIITFDALMESGATRVISAVRVLETPGPTYMPDTTKLVEGGGGQAFVSWADLGYALDPVTDRFEAFVRPNAVMDAGDTFTAEVIFTDGSTEQFSRMINYVFKNIPKLLRYGTAGSLTAFDVTDPTVDGSPGKPIPFDGTQDLVLVFNPPPDETGAYITDMDYSFQVGYFGAGGTQLNQDIDKNATWPTPPVGFQTQNLSYYVQSEDLSLAGDDTYTFTVPKEVFPDTVRTTSSGDAAVERYKIDITAEAPTGNAAIMLTFVKQ